MSAYPNGKIPASALAVVDFAPGHLLMAPADRALERLNTAFRKRFGVDLTINEAYRPLQTQETYWARAGELVTHQGRKVQRRYLPVGHALRFVASRPGTSEHGFGLAVDLGQLGGFGSEKHRWLTEHAGEFGFWQPPQYRQGGQWPEPWHWEYRQTHDQHLNDQEDEMSAEDVKKITEHVDKKIAALVKELQRVSQTYPWVTDPGTGGRIDAEETAERYFILLRRIVAGQVDPARLAAELVPGIVAALGDRPGATVSRKDLEAALRTVLGSLDE